MLASNCNNILIFPYGLYHHLPLPPPTYEHDAKPLCQRLSYLPLPDHGRVAPYASLAIRFSMDCLHSQSAVKLLSFIISTTTNTQLSAESLFHHTRWENFNNNGFGISIGVLHSKSKLSGVLRSISQRL